MLNRIRGILFDSGDTLLRPIGGRWNPRFDFEEVLLRHRPDVDVNRFPAAIAEGGRYLAEAPSTPSRDDYHRAVLRVLGIQDPPQGLLADLDRPLDSPVLEPFPEVEEVLEELRGHGVAMAIVSDSWPGLPSTYRQLGLHGYSEIFVISANLGCNKPDPRMFAAASESLGLEPGDCLFVDDDPALVEAAIDLGYHGVTIWRGYEPEPSGVPCITSLREVLHAVKASPEPPPR